MRRHDSARCSTRSGTRTSSREEPGAPGGPLRRPAPRPRGDLAAGVRRAARARPRACAGRTARSRRWITRSPTHRAARRSSTTQARGAARARSSENCAEFGIALLRRSARATQGIVHVIGPELGLTQPGMTIVCGDSHTSTHGAFGALAFGIGTSEVEHVLATQCLLQRKPKTLEVRVDGALGAGRRPPRTSSSRSSPRSASAAAPATSSSTPASAIRALDMEGADDGLQHVDRGGRARRHDRARRRRRSQYLARARARAAGRRLGRGGRALAHAAHRRRRDATTARSRSTRRARADDHLRHEPGHGHRRSRGRCPRPTTSPTPSARRSRRRSPTWGSTPGEPLLGQPVDVVFIGSCTNSRIGDLRAAAARPARAARSPPGVRVLVVPGSQRGQARRPRPRGSTASSATPAPSGASRAARCASP